MHRTHVCDGGVRTRWTRNRARVLRGSVRLSRAVRLAIWRVLVDERVESRELQRHARRVDDVLSRRSFARAELRSRADDDISDAHDLQRRDVIARRSQLELGGAVVFDVTVVLGVAVAVAIDDILPDAVTLAVTVTCITTDDGVWGRRRYVLGIVRALHLPRFNER